MDFTVNTERDRGQFKFSWTAPGANYDVGAGKKTLEFIHECKFCRSDQTEFFGKGILSVVKQQPVLQDVLASSPKYTDVLADYKDAYILAVFNCFYATILLTSVFKCRISVFFKVISMQKTSLFKADSAHFVNIHVSSLCMRDRKYGK